MAFSYVLAGYTFTQENFEGVAYADEDSGFPKALEKIIEHTKTAWVATSTDSLTVGTGTTGNVTTDGPHSFAVGQPVTIARTSDPSVTSMFGIVTAYDDVTGDITVLVESIRGTGTFTDWTISLGGFSELVTAALPVSIANGGTSATTAAAARAALGIAFGTGDLPVSIANGGTGAATASAARSSLAVLGKAANLSDLTGPLSTVRTNLGLGTAATKNEGAASTLNADLLDGSHGSFFLARANHTGTQSPGTISGQGAGGGFDADLLDGLHAADIAAGGMPSGTKVMFLNNAAPAGWTFISYAANEYVISLASSAGQGGGSTGSWTIIGLTVPAQSTDGHALTTAQMPSHSHGSFFGSFLTDSGVPPSGNGFNASAVNTLLTSANTAPTGGGSIHSHNVPLSNVSSYGTWRPRSIRVIVCSKD